MAIILPMSKIQIIAERHGMPRGLVAYRNRFGFQSHKLGVTEIVDGEMVSGKFEWPGTESLEKKPEKTGGGGFEYPLKAPVTDGVNRGVKITRKRSRLKN